MSQSRNSKGIKKRFWLVKVPSYVANDWFSPNREDDALGTLTVTAQSSAQKASNKYPEMKLTAALHDPVLPSDFNLNVRNAERVEVTNPKGDKEMKEKKLVVFADRVNGDMKAEEPCPITSTVNWTIDARAVNNQKYRNYLRTKSTSSAVNRPKSSSMSIMEMQQAAKIKYKSAGSRAKGGEIVGLRLNRTGKTTVVGAKSLSEKKKEKRREMRIRDDESVVKNKILAAFDHKPFFRLNELRDITNQPTSYLKEVLNLVCDYHREGDHRFHYSLKKDFMLESDQKMINAENEKRKQEQLEKNASFAKNASYAKAKK